MALDSPETVALLLWMTVGPVVFFAGVFGNVIILIVLRRGATLGHHGNTTLYVTLIAVADLVVLLTGMVNEWLKVRGSTLLVLTQQERRRPSACGMKWPDPRNQQTQVSGQFCSGVKWPGMR